MVLAIPDPAAAVGLVLSPGLPDNGTTTIGRIVPGKRSVAWFPGPSGLLTSWTGAVCPLPRVPSAGQLFLRRRFLSPAGGRRGRIGLLRHAGLDRLAGAAAPRPPVRVGPREPLPLRQSPSTPERVGRGRFRRGPKEARGAGAGSDRFPRVRRRSRGGLQDSRSLDHKLLSTYRFWPGGSRPNNGRFLCFLTFVSLCVFLPPARGQGPGAPRWGPGPEDACCRVRQFASISAWSAWPRSFSTAGSLS